MRVCIHRGSKQIGGSCVELEAQGHRIVLDLGLPLDAETNDRRYLPAINGFDGSDPSLRGILISHPHLDHYGLLSHVSQNIKVGLGPAARRMLKAASDFVPGDWPIPVAGWDYKSGQTFEIGPFRVTPHLVDHSAFDAYALLIEAEGKRLFYSGDFRGHGRKSALFEKMLANPPTDIDALLVEGSSLGRLGADEAFPTESDIEAQLATTFRATAGLALVHTSAQNIDRIVSILRAARKTGRTLVIDLYAAALLEATGNANLPQSGWKDVALFVPEAQRRHVKRNALFDLLSKHSKNRIFAEHLKADPSKFAILFRPLHRFDLERAECLIDARYVYSQWEGYWEGGTYDNLRDWIHSRSIPKLSVHTSGHASPKDLKAFVKAVAPRRVVSIHTFRPELYPTMFDNVEPHADGEWWGL
ncbi:Beta-lactamase superfamily domain-containing protein [Caballeronia arationis]|uniref:Beta-lactamase superfamily domain-containing protein n=1 Tax=Caballeronia arationis TaxID=1777142 RepID=A0A7Z7I8U2_9BURK|nr:MBL fold metallo-hydrolase [Caballeronia arationis]SOE81037.1 Beta-lactamase superfamily domain-containing protein [Caballeronia arationis]